MSVAPVASRSCMLCRAALSLISIAAVPCCADDYDRPPDFRGEEEYAAPFVLVLDRAFVEEQITQEANSSCLRKFGRPLEDIDFRWRQCNVLASTDNTDECVRWRAWCEQAPRLPDPLEP